MNLSEDTSTILVKYTSLFVVCSSVIYVGGCLGLFIVPIYFCGFLIIIVNFVLYYID